MTTRRAYGTAQQAAGATIWPLSSRRRARRGFTGAKSLHPAPLQRGERLLLSVRGINGLPVLATDRAVYHQHDHRLDSVWTRLGWEQVDRADWDADRQRLILKGVTPGVPGRTELQLSDGVELMLLARERIRWTTLLSGQLHLGDLGDAHVTVRREPATDALLWVVRLHPDVNPDDPGLSACVDVAIAGVRANAGI